MLAQLHINTGPIIIGSYNRSRGFIRSIARTVVVVLLNNCPIGGYIVIAIYVYLYDKFKYIYNYGDPYGPVLSSGARKKILLSLMGIILLFILG